MNCRGSVSTETTSWVFCAVRATIAEVPWTPQRANAFRSAWIPAPPPESEVAIVIAVGTRDSACTRARLEGRLCRLGQRKRGALVAPVAVAAQVARKLEADQGGGEGARVEPRRPRQGVGGP